MTIRSCQVQGCPTSIISCVDLCVLPFFAGLSKGVDTGKQGLSSSRILLGDLADDGAQVMPRSHFPSQLPVFEMAGQAKDLGKVFQ